MMSDIYLYRKLYEYVQILRIPEEILGGKEKITDTALLGICIWTIATSFCSTLEGRGDAVSIGDIQMTYIIFTRGKTHSNYYVLSLIIQFVLTLMTDLNTGMSHITCENF